MSDVVRDGDRPAPWSAIWTAAPFAAALVVGACSVGVVADLRGSGLAYSSESTGASLMTLFAGLGLIVAGAVHRFTHRRGGLGVLAAALGLTWLAAEWIGWSDGPAWVRSAGMIVAPLYVPIVVHMVLAIPNGRIAGRLERVLTAVAYAGAVMISILLCLVRDPFRDLYCWRNCTDNSFLVYSAPDLASALIIVALYATAVAAVVVSGAAIAHLMAAPSHRRRQLHLLVPGVAMALSLAVYAGVLLAEPAERPGRAIFAVVFLARATVLIAFAVGLLFAVLSELRVRQSIARLAIELGEAPPPGSLRAALSRSLGDDQLDVAFWSSEREVYLDPNGQVVHPDPSPSQTITAIARGGERVAVVVHDRALAATRDLEREIGSASRLAVDNERLRAQALAQLADLRASRARIVETSDRTRRRLERDLHDGAQQRLLALLYELHLARDDAMAADDRHLAARLSNAHDIAMRALVELRDLAQGIYPAILSEAGLGPALATFADTAPLHLELVGVPEVRLGHEAETVAYLTVLAATERATRRMSKSLVATFTADIGVLSIDIVDDGCVGTADNLVNLCDRVGALGGNLVLEDAHVRTVIPCE
ncbi:MAG: histidine kinase [Ilumatobacteraceae bacterium]